MMAPSTHGKATLHATMRGADGKVRDLGRIDRKWWAPKAWWFRFITQPIRRRRRRDLRRSMGRLALFLNVLLANIYTSVGKAYVCAKLDGTNTNSPNKIGWGTGTGTAAIGDTALFTEAAEARVTATLDRITTTVTNDTFRAQGTLTTASDQTIRNAGLFDSASGGILILHSDHAALPLLTGDTIAYVFGLVQA